MSPESILPQHDVYERWRKEAEAKELPVSFQEKLSAFHQEALKHGENGTSDVDRYIKENDVMNIRGYLLDYNESRLSSDDPEAVDRLVRTAKELLEELTAIIGSPESEN